MIYFIKPVGMDGPIKIGTTRGDVKLRLKAMQTGSPFELEVIGTTPGGVIHERALHAYFSKTRTRLEWFEYSDELMSAIDYFCNEKNHDWSFFGVPAPLKTYVSPPNFGGWQSSHIKNPGYYKPKKGTTKRRSD